VEEESTILLPKPGIPYENRGPVTFWVNGAVIAAMDGIRLLPEVEAVETIVVRTGDGWLGGGISPVVIVMKEI
jgi:hypothetical protein